MSGMSQLLTIVSETDGRFTGACLNFWSLVELVVCRGNHSGQHARYDVLACQACMKFECVLCRPPLTAAGRLLTLWQYSQACELTGWTGGLFVSNRAHLFHRLTHHWSAFGRTEASSCLKTDRNLCDSLMDIPLFNWKCVVFSTVQCGMVIWTMKSVSQAWLLPYQSGETHNYNFWDSSCFCCALFTVTRLSLNCLPF